MSTFLLESTRTPRCRVQIIDLISLAVRALSSGSEPYAAAFPQICELEGLDNDIASPLRFSPVLFLIFSYSPSFFSLFFFFYYRDEQFFGISLPIERFAVAHSIGIKIIIAK